MRAPRLVRVGTEQSAGGFSVYVEGPRDRDVLAAWARRLSPPLARAFEPACVILGGRQPARAAGLLARRRDSKRPSGLRARQRLAGGAAPPPPQASILPWPLTSIATSCAAAISHGAPAATAPLGPRGGLPPRRRRRCSPLANASSGQGPFALSWALPLPVGTARRWRRGIPRSALALPRIAAIGDPSPSRLPLAPPPRPPPRRGMTGPGGVCGVPR